MAGLKEWEETSISWIDEFHDIAARMPFEQGFRISQIAVAPLTRSGIEKKDSKEKKVARMTIHGVMNARQDKFVNTFNSAIGKDPHLSLASPEYKTNEFILKIDVAPQAGKKYATSLVVPANPSFVRKNGKAAAAAMEPDEPVEPLEQQPAEVDP